MFLCRIFALINSMNVSRKTKSHLKVTKFAEFWVIDEAFVEETSKHGPYTFLKMCSLLFKERTFVFLFAKKDQF